MRSVRLLLSMGLALWPASASVAQQIQINKDNKTIAITTSGSAEALADVAEISIGFHIYGKDQDGTYAEASKDSNAIMTALTAMGVLKDAIESTGQSLSPIDPGNESDKLRYGQGIRFEFSQSWRVTAPASMAAAVLHAGIMAGANDSGNVQWELSKDDALEAEAARKALEHARQIASQMASGLGVKLGTLVYASNQTPPRGLAAILGFSGAQLETENATMGGVRKNLAPLALSPEKISRAATVYAVFAIE